MRRIRNLTLLLALCAGTAACAGEAAPKAADPALEARVLKLSAELRCLVCQNQTIADSNAELAVDLKKQVREQLAAGRSDQQIIDYMTERYGDFVLYRPPVKGSTLLLWGGPALLLLIGLGLYWRSLRRAPEPAAADDAGPSEAERQRAAQLLAAPAADEPRR